MILQTIQHESVLLELENNNIIVATKENNPNYNHDYQLAYDWLKKQMINRNILPKSKEVELIWAWAYSGDNGKREVDINVRKEELKDSVLITFEKKDNEILLSEFEFWHFALNYWYLATSKPTEEYWDDIVKNEIDNYYVNKPLKNKVFHEEIETSWETILKVKEVNGQFIWDLPKDIIEYFGKQSLSLSVQATMWNIKKSEIINIKVF